MKILYDIINVMPLSLLMVMFFSRYTGMPQDNIIGYAVNLFVCLLIIVLRHISRKNRIRLLGVTAAFVVGLFIAAGEPFRQLVITEYSWLGWNVCITVASVAIGILTENIPWARRCAALSLLVICIVAIINSWETGKAAFALMLFLLCIYTVAEIQSKWEKKGYPDINGHVTRISPIILALCITVFLIPAPDTPYDWQFVKDIYNKASVYFSKLIEFISHPDEEYANISFSDSHRFYDNIQYVDQEVLVVTSNNTRITNLRLVGCISGEYDRDHWVFDTEKETTDRMMDTLETLCAVHKYDAENWHNYIDKTDMRYKNQLPNTRFIFAPAKMKLETFIKDNPPYTDRGNSIITRHRMNSGDGYSLSHYTLNSDSPEFIDMLAAAQPVTEAEWTNILNDASIAKNGYSFSDYQNYHNKIYNRYAISYGVSEDVGKILDKIENDSQNRYELMKNLEAYLREMEYSTVNGALPDSVCDSRSYLDYFLLTSQKGYCIHYATAFVLMAREMGVPCRYVQGYYVQSESSYKVTVNQSQAHAWPEVYFDNVGWIAFEPTPSYSTESGWITSGGNASFSYYEEDYIYDTEVEETDITVEEKKHKSRQIDARIFIIPVLCAVIFLVLLYLYSRIHWKIKFRRMTNDEKFRFLTQENFRFLKHIGYKIEIGETLKEYTKRLCAVQEYDIREYIAFISHYEKKLYSDIVIGEQEIADAETSHAFLRNIINKGKLRYRVKMLFNR